MRLRRLGSHCRSQATRTKREIAKWAVVATLLALWFVGKRRTRRRVLGALRLTDGGESFDVEAMVVGVAGHFVHLESFQKQNAGANVSFFIRGKPDFVVEERLLENEAGALLQVGD